jgi:flagellar hook protein FlgE
MLDLYVNVKNTLQGLMQALRISISNANNFNTPGYKYTSVSFTTVYSEAISSGSETTNPMSTGSAMQLGATSQDFSQGSLTIGTGLDAAVFGEGFFMISQDAVNFAANAGTTLYTRSGRFQRDFENKYLTDAFGRKVFGFKVDANGDPINKELVPIETNGETDIGFLEGGILAADFSISKNNEGVKPRPLYRLALTTVQNKGGLVSVAGGAYKTTVASGEQLSVGISGSSISAEASGIYGAIFGEMVESSNVEIAKVALDMNLLQRGFSATQGIIDNITKTIQGLMQKIGG